MPSVEIVECPRCGMEFKGISGHLKACRKVPPPDKVAQLFVKDPKMTHTAMSGRLGVSASFLKRHLLAGGITRSAIRARSKKRAKPKNTQLFDFDRCGICTIYIVKDGSDLPSGWSWNVSLAVDGLCIGCALGR